MFQDEKTDTRNTGIRLNLELGSEVLVQTDGKKMRLKGIVVGMDPDAYLIVRIPPILKISEHLKEGNPFYVRYCGGGNNYGFAATLLGSIVKPYRLIFLSYPDTIDQLELRKKSRVSCYIPVIAKLGDTEVKGVITDISQSGCRFSVKVPVPLQPKQIQVLDELSLFFPVFGMDKVQEFRGNVRNTTLDRERIGLGIEFEKIDASISIKIAEYMKSMADYEGG